MIAIKDCSWIVKLHRDKNHPAKVYVSLYTDNITGFETDMEADDYFSTVEEAKTFVKEFMEINDFKYYHFKETYEEVEDV